MIFFHCIKCLSVSISLHLLTSIRGFMLSVDPYFRNKNVERFMHKIVDKPLVSIEVKKGFLMEIISYYPMDIVVNQICSISESLESSTEGLHIARDLLVELVMRTDLNIDDKIKGLGQISHRNCGPILTQIIKSVIEAID